MYFEKSTPTIGTDQKVKFLQREDSRDHCVLDTQVLAFQVLGQLLARHSLDDEVTLAAHRLTEYSFLQTQKAVDEGLPTYEQHHLETFASSNPYI